MVKSLFLLRVVEGYPRILEDILDYFLTKISIGRGFGSALFAIM